MGRKPAHRRTRGGGARRLLAAAGAGAALLLVLAPAAGLSQTEGEADAAQLRQGQDVYLQSCSGCHQPSGLGLAGAFPPLRNNPNVADAEHVRTVLANGLTGPIVVNGETFDGIMPPFATLSDDDVAAVIAFLQNDLTVPGEPAPAPSDEPPAGTTLPPIATSMFGLAFLIALAIAGAVAAPRVVAVIDRTRTSGIDVALKSGLIVVYFVVGTVVVPSVVLQSKVVTNLPRGVQDFVATSLWLGALAVGMLALWWFQRQDRI